MIYVCVCLSVTDIEKEGITYIAKLRTVKKHFFFSIYHKTSHSRLIKPSLTLVAGEAV